MKTQIWKAAEAFKVNNNQIASGLSNMNQATSNLVLCKQGWTHEFFYEIVWQMECEQLWNCFCEVHRILPPTVALTNANPMAAQAGHTPVMGPWYPCPMVSTGSCPQLCSWPNSHSCTFPDCRRREYSKETHTACSELLKLTLLKGRQIHSASWGEW